jgi:hypothetical protein
MIKKGKEYIYLNIFEAGWAKNTKLSGHTSFSGMYPLLTDQLTWKFTMLNGPSKLGWDLGAAIVDGLADQNIIPILYRLAESYRWGPFYILNWLAKNCKNITYSIWYRQAGLEESPISTDQPGWYLTHLVWAGQTIKKPTINRSASHTSQWISPIVDLPANLTKVHYEPASQTLDNPHIKPSGQQLLWTLQTGWLVIVS